MSLRRSERLQGVFYDKRNAFQSVRLRTICGEHLYGYVPSLGTCLYKELVKDILADGNPHDITLKIANRTDDTIYPVIDEVLSSTWILPDKAVKTEPAPLSNNK